MYYVMPLALFRLASRRLLKFYKAYVVSLLFFRAPRKRHANLHSFATHVHGYNRLAWCADNVPRGDKHGSGA